MKKILTVTAVLALVCASVFAVGFKAQAGVGLDVYKDNWFGLTEEVLPEGYYANNASNGIIIYLDKTSLSKTAASINLGGEYGFENGVGIFVDAGFDIPVKYTMVVESSKTDLTEEFKEGELKDAKKYDFKLAIGANYLVAELMNNLDVTVGLGVQGRGQYFALDDFGGYLNVTIGAVAKASAFYSFNEKLSAGLDLAADYALYKITKADLGESVYQGTFKGGAKGLGFSAVAAVKYAF